MMTRRTMRGLLVTLFLLTASVAGCGDTSDESSPSTSTRTEGVGEALEGLELHAPAPSTGRPGGASKTDFGGPREQRSGTQGGDPGNPGDEVFEPVPVPWDTPRVKVASEG